MNENLEVNLRVPFESSRLAEIAYNSLRVDKEPKRGGTNRELRLEDTVLHVRWTGTEARKLRVSLNGFLDHLQLVTQTMDQFGPPVTS